MSGKPSLGKGLPSQVKQSSQGRREPSGGAYTMFTPQQIKQFKEAFTMIDQDGDGRVTESDLREMLSNLGTYLNLWMGGWYWSWHPRCSLSGQTPTPELLHSLLTSRPGGSATAQSKSVNPSDGVNFTQFLSMMGERLIQLDPEQDLVDAFACFDDGDKGYVDVKTMRKYLGELGDRMEDWEVGLNFF